MHGLSCDRCGKSLLVDEEVRYVMRLEVDAAWDPPEVMRADLDRDLEAEMRRLVRAAERRDPKELEEEVAVRRRYDLCPPCRRKLLEDPLRTGGG